ncbi:hypothetical protein [Streptomyces sp. RKAG293]|uniref:hypothetical protein n=1 Tax=Streptomyces sp. RKAG293 TaxID=2893403 RepID=UPI002033FB11|nr:hypothetical protein [Streptomyces sp. RKAG293]MCM2417662.1 hypothetical protein [Streptomyces sp. RKAG293]
MTRLAGVFRTLRDTVASIKAVLYVIGIGLAAWGFLADFRLALIVAAVVTVTFGAIWLWVTRYYEPCRFVVDSLETTLLVERKDNYHRYTRTRIVHLTARRNNLRIFEMRLQWTGQAGPGRIGPLESLNPDHKAFTAPREDENHLMYSWVYLGRSLNRGESETISVVQTFEDDLQEMKRFHYDAATLARAKKIRVITRFPRGEEPMEVTGHTWYRAKNPGSNTKCVRKVDATSDHVDFIVEVDDPKRYRSYGVRW